MAINRTQQKNDYNKEHYKRVALNVQFYEYEIWKKFADKLNKPMNTVIKDAMKKYIESSSKG